MVENLKVIEHLGNSDHNIITWRLICKVHVGKSQKPTRQYHKVDYDSMRVWLGQIDWSREFRNEDVEGKWSKFCEILDKAVEKFVPLGYRRSKKFPKWMNKEAKAASINKKWGKCIGSQEHTLIW